MWVSGYYYLSFYVVVVVVVESNNFFYARKTIFKMINVICRIVILNYQVKIYDLISATFIYLSCYYNNSYILFIYINFYLKCHFV